VLDLDDTMWGGVVGDDGVAGIKIGHGDAIGEAHLAFQTYVKQLEQRGVMLAVCSKNEEANALAPFEERPEMVVKRDDILAFKANWEPKPDNIRAIARELDIGLDSLVFVDDNPVEREHVRLRLPQVRVVELTDDPADYVRLLDETGWFEVTEIGSEDRARSAQYRANAAREEARESVTDYAAYLADLKQVAVLKPYEELHLGRITQLINRSNQFNLTTRRQSRTEVEAEMKDPNRITAYVRLKDRFGDNGLISVFSSFMEGDTLRIDQWLMSCRVFARGVEQLLFNTIVERAKARGVKTIYGVYLPTVKNVIVKDLYEKLGFEADDDVWRLHVGDFSPFDVKIEVAEDY
jgi:FkbH-like protein